jgi:hypothetical protein
VSHSFAAPAAYFTTAAEVAAYFESAECLAEL